MGYAEKYLNNELASGKELCPPGTYVFQVVSTIIPKTEDGSIPLGKYGDGAGVPEIRVVACPLRDPDNAKSVERDYGVFYSLSIPFDTPTSVPLTESLLERLTYRLTATLGSMLPEWNSKDRKAKATVFKAVDELAVKLFNERGNVDGATFIAEVTHNKSEKTGQVYANLRGVRQKLGEAQLTALE